MKKIFSVSLLVFTLAFGCGINGYCQPNDGASDVATMATSVIVANSAASGANQQSAKASQSAEAPHSAYEVANLKAQKDAKFLKSICDAIIESAQKSYPSFADFLKIKIFDVDMVRILMACSIVLFAWLFQYVVIFVLFRLLMSKFGGVKTNTLTSFLTKLRKPASILIIIFGLNGALYTIIDHPDSIMVVGRLFWVFIDICLFWIVANIGDFVFDIMHNRVSRRYTAAINLVELGRRLFRSALIVFLLIIILDLCGANVSAVLASLGIGGAALAFASKDTIANFFGSVSLVADRPFAVGDWIVAGDVEGVVESIGIRSTRVRTFPKTVVTIPNSILANESINNMSKMPLRRTDFSVGLTYSTTPEQMLATVEDIRKILIKHPEIDNDSFVVNFTNFGASSLDIAIVYYARSLDYASTCRTRQEINIEIMKAVNARGLSFAFPSTSVYFETPLKSGV